MAERYDLKLSLIYKVLRIDDAQGAQYADDGTEIPVNQRQVILVPDSAQYGSASKDSLSHEIWIGARCEPLILKARHPHGALNDVEVGDVVEVGLLFSKPGAPPADG